jgi:hypothetical protein
MSSSHGFPKLAASRGKGNEAEIFEIIGLPGQLAKKYHNSRHQTSIEGMRLIALIKLIESSCPSDKWMLTNSTAMPIELYGEQKQIHGFRMTDAGKSFQILLHVRGVSKERKAATIDWLLKETALSAPGIESCRMWNESRGTEVKVNEVTFFDRTEIAFHASQVFPILWKNNVRYGDFSSQNFLWTSQDVPRFFIVDADTIRQQGEEGVHSPDWQPHPSLRQSIEADRSLAALLIWRILRQDLHAEPSVEDSMNMAREVPDQFYLDLISLYTTGDEDSWDAVVTGLRSIRSLEHQSRAFEWIRQSRCASLVLDYAPTNPSMAERQIIEAAKRQKQLESKLAALSPRRLRLRMRSAQLESGFDLDMAHQEHVKTKINNNEKLWELLNRGEFVLIADAAVHGRITISDDFLVSRAIEHALHEQDPPQLEIVQQSSAGYVSCSFDWPTSNWINAARIEITSEDGKNSNFSIQERLLNEWKKRTNFSLDAGYGLRPRLKVSWAVELPSGSSMSCSKGTTIVLNGNTNGPTLAPPQTISPEVPPVRVEPSVIQPPVPRSPTTSPRVTSSTVITPVREKSRGFSRLRRLFKR